ncbi:MAG: beta-glucosidase BglX [Planctomycetes bacterium]|nr:beta-glucosidase BglX [Planctomycetota bacterium]
MKIRIKLLSFLLSLSILSAAQNVFAVGLTTEKKVEELLQKMTLEEKIGQMYQSRDGGQDSILKLVQKGNVGSFLGITDIILRNKLQKIAVEKSRLGIPLIFGFDTIHGYKTVFPIPLGQAASWNPKLAEKVAAVSAKESRSDGIDWVFAPMVDIARDARWGRIAEGFGEDTYLASLMAQAKVRGLQGYGDGLFGPDKVAACLKHYAGYGAAEGGRDYNTCEISQRTLREIYLPPFQAGVQAGAATIMSGFNEISGVPVTASRFLLTDILRGEWGFDGFVVSDYTSVRELIPHGIAIDETQAGKKALLAGIDMEMSSRCYLNNLSRLVRQDKISEKVIDQAVRRILRIKFDIGLFDNPYADPNKPSSVLLHKDHLELAREMARQSVVLLKNTNGILPVSKDIKSIALIGPLADSREDMMGTWKGVGDAEDVVTILEGIQDKASAECKINYVKGCDVKGDLIDGFAQAVEAAKKSDVVIMAVGESEKMSGEAHSRASLDLPGVQRELIEEVQKTGKPIVVLLLTGRPLAITWIDKNIPTILLGWHPGTQGGNGIADVIFGDYNPSGKITATFPRNVGQVPIYYNCKNTGRPPSESEYHTSRYIDSHWTPLYPFGYGLSYTTFHYSNLKVSPDKISMEQPVTISVDVKNAGKRAGEEIVQLYVRDVVGSVTRPVKELKGFEKILLKHGEKKTVSFTLTAEQLKFYNIDNQFVAESGMFKVMVGKNSVDCLESEFELTK